MVQAKKNIVLVGFMGTGKTTIGKILASRLGKKFIETDSIIEEMAGKSIPAIFSEDGEIRFRELEIEACKQAAEREDVVISCGGGIILNFINIQRLNQTGVVICLEASPAVIYNRIMAEGKEKRPLLAKPDPMAEIHKILHFREPLYQRASDCRVDTDNLSLEGVAEKIIEIFEGQA